MSHRPSLLFLATGLVAAVFIVTVFVMIAALFSDPELPINQWLNRYSLPLLLGEVVLLVALGLAAMMLDRSSSETPSPGESDE